MALYDFNENLESGFFYVPGVSALCSIENFPDPRLVFLDTNKRLRVTPVG
jgi:hypothetical protein